MSHLSVVTTYLQEKPAAGIISGFGAGLIVWLQKVLTDDHILKIVSGLAAWCGLAIAILSVVVWLVKVYDLLIIRFKIKKP